MNKKQRIDIMHKRADEYAESGQYRNYQGIENQLSQEGFREAKNELNDRGIRDKLDELCRIAISTEEVERRTKFKEWINNIAIPSETLIKQALTDVQIVGLDDKYMLKGSDCTITIEREFGTTRIKASSSGHNRNEEYFPHDCELDGNPTFDTLDSNSLVRLIVDLYEKEKTLFKNL